MKENPGGEGGRGANAPVSEGHAFTALLVHIDERLHEPLSVESLARRAGLSPFHFARQFRKIVGQPPHEYIIGKRMARACELLATTTLPVSEIARRIGFGTQAHFSATFRERVGLTPTAYRARHGSNP